MRLSLRLIMRHLNMGSNAACSGTYKGYEEAVRMLNTLQSNAQTLELARKDKNKTRLLNLPATIKFCQRTGISLDDIDKLNIIHISGTKGKGSTSAFCERLLRGQGYKTGFFSSPHLVEVRERIRINGRPLSKDAFSYYFWDCYNKLVATKEENDGAMPAYFRFLTIMAFNVFREEKVDVAIMEVGIGGTYDCTNIVRQPVVCGVTSLGYDHMSLLGDTLASIAWHKAGIFKKGVPAITSPQEEEAMQVLIDRAKENQCELRVAPSLEEYDWRGNPIQLGIAGKMQGFNASLALQLCQTWLTKHCEGINGGKELTPSELEGVKVADTFSITEDLATALRETQWAGRNQTVEKDGLTYYIDGAHTPDSMKQCVEWFINASEREEKRIGKKVIRLLVFNMTGDRTPASLMMPLLDCKIDCAVFCPNIATASTVRADQTNFMVTTGSQHNKCVINRNAWLEVLSNQFSCSAPGGSMVDSDSLKLSGEGDGQSKQANVHNQCEQSSANFRPVDQNIMPTFVFNSISEALLWASQGREDLIDLDKQVLPPIPEALENPAHIQVLVTGSLHLVGGVLSLIKPDIND